MNVELIQKFESRILSEMKHSEDEARSKKAIYAVVSIVLHEGFNAEAFRLWLMGYGWHYSEKTSSIGKRIDYLA